MIEDLINDSYNWFVDLVAERRSLSRPEALKLADGRVYSGDRGLKNKLIDAVGGESTAKQWLIEQKELDKDLEIKDWKPLRESDGLPFIQAISSWLLGKESNAVHAISVLNPDDLPAIFPKRLFLEGLLSIWHK